MDNLPRCEGCGAPVTLGRGTCAYCDRLIPWGVILTKLPDSAVVLFADNIPVLIEMPDG